MVPDYSFSYAMSACLIAMLPEGFYDMVDEGSIILKKSKTFSFCANGIIWQDGNECIKSDIVILATGFRGDQKLRGIFTANWCKRIVTGSPDTAVPLYRYTLDFSPFSSLYICNISSTTFHSTDATTRMDTNFTTSQIGVALNNLYIEIEYVIKESQA
jgi:hypothetical protein